MSPRVQLTFDGNPNGALGATRKVAAGLTALKAETKALSLENLAAAGAQGKLTQEMVVGTTATRRHAGAAASAEKEISRLSRGALAGSGIFHGYGRSIAFASGAFLGGAGLTAVLSAAFRQMEQGQVITAQTNTTIKATGAVAGITAKGIDALAKAEARKTGADVNAVRSAENLLLTFRYVRNEVGKGNDIFNQAAKMADNLSHTWGMDLSASAELLGKALNNPFVGYVRLQRQGVTFTNQQKEQIKQFQKTGDVVGAQHVILDELNRTVGKSAEAYGKTLPGAIGRARNAARDLEASLLTGLTPAFTEGANKLADWVDKQQKSGDLQRKVNTVIKDGAVIFRGIRDSIKVAADAFRGLSDAVGGDTRALTILGGALVGAKLLGGLSTLATAAGGGKGAAGAVGLLNTRLRALMRFAEAAIVIDVILNVVHNKTSVKGAGMGWIGHIPGLNAIVHAGQAVGNAIVPPPGRDGPGSFAVTMQLPTSFAATHSTRGADWAGATPDAVDLMAKPGVAVKAPEDGSLTRISGHDPASAPSEGVGGPWGRSFYFAGDSGTVYFGTHLSDVAPLGRYNKGDIIAIIGDYPGLKADHIHWAIVGSGQAAMADATAPSTQPSTLARPNGVPPATSSTSSASSIKFTPQNPADFKSKAKKAKALDVTALSDPLRLKLANAGATATLADDIAAEQAAVAFLTSRLNKTTKTGVRADLQNAINQYEDAIKAAEQTIAKKAADAARRAKEARVKAGGRLSEETGIGRAFSRSKATIEQAFRLDLLPVSEEAKLQAQMTRFADLVRRAKKDGAISPAELRSIKGSWGAMAAGISDATQAVQANLQKTAASKWAGITNAISRAVAEAWSTTQRDFGRETDLGLKAINDKASADIEQMSRDFLARMDVFNRETAAGLKALEVLQTPTEALLAQREAAKTSGDTQARLAELTKARADAVTAEQEAQNAAGNIRSRGAESIESYNKRVQDAQDAVTQATADRVKAEKDLNAEIYDEETTSLQARAVAERKAADEKTQAAQDAYQASRDALAQSLAGEERDRERARQTQADGEAQAYQDRRDAQWQALQDLHDDQTTALTADLDQWGTWLSTKQRNYADFLRWLSENTVSQALAGVGPDPFTPAGGPLDPGQGTSPDNRGGVRGTGAAGSFVWGGITWGPGDRSAFAAWLASRGASLDEWKKNHASTAAAVGYWAGGTVPLGYVGARDTVMARVTPGEEIVDRSTSVALRAFLANPGAYGGGSGRPIVLQIDGREFARLTAQPMSDAQVRLLGYNSQRS